MNTRSRLFKAIAHTLIGVMCWQPLFSLAADLRVDAKAGANAQITQAGNGVPVVNIATPNGQGLSHNTFTDYNVDQQGLILNNSTDKFTPTQLGGIIVGNSQLQGQSAQLILNEVSGGQASQLKGYTEVAGQQAHVVVANPHGVTCDGCGFINTPHVTLTTGRPIIEQGNLSRYDVDGGQIEIAGKGLNATNISQFDLITRSAKINAELHANQLNIVTGRNTVDALTLAATAKADRPDDKPNLAIDSSALGGMYAGAIRLVGTEAGVGVKLAGDMAASAGDIQIDASGKLTLARASAKQQISANAQEVDLTQQVYAGDRIKVQTDKLTNKAKLLAANGIDITASHIDNQGLIEAGLRADYTLNSSADVHIQSSTLTNAGSVIASRNLHIDAKQNISNKAGQLVADADLTVTTKQLDNQQGLLTAAGKVNVSAQQIDNRNQGELSSQQQLTVRADTLNNSDSGRIISETDLSVTAQDLDNRQSGIIAADKKLTVRAGSIDNSAQGLIKGAHALAITADILNNQDGGRVLSRADLQLDTRQLNNTDGFLDTQGLLSIVAQSIDNIRGQIVGDSGVRISSDRLDNRAGGLILSRDTLTATVNEFNNQQGILVADAGVTLKGQTLNNDAGQVTSQNTVELDYTQLNNTQGLIAAGNALTVTAQTIENANGELSAGHALTLDTQLLQQKKGQIRSAGEMIMSVQTLDNSQGGVISSQESIVLNIGALNNQQGQLVSEGSLELTQSGKMLDNRAGLIHATDSLMLNNLQDVDNRQGGEISSQKAFQLRLDNLDNSQGGVIVSHQQLKIDAKYIDNQQGGLLSGLAGLQVSADNLNNQGLGTLSSRAGELTVQVAGQVNNSAQGALVSQQALNIQAGSLDNQQGIISSEKNVELQIIGDLENYSGQISGRDITLSADNLFNTEGQVSAEQTLTINLLQALLNQQNASIISGQQLLLTANTINNHNSMIASEGLLFVFAQHLRNEQQATIAANNQLKLQVQQIDNQSQGRIYSQNADVVVQADTLSNNNGLIQARDALSLDIQQQLTNQSGRVISEQGAVSIQAHTVDNREGIFASLIDQLTLDVRGLFNNQSGTAQGQSVAVQAYEVTNQGGHLAATVTDLELSASTLNNQGGGLYALQNLVVSGQHLDNSAQGKIAANTIDFSLSGALNNQAGLIEADHLHILVDSINNTQGRLRALAAADNNVIGTRGVFDNRNGSVDIASTNFTLDTSNLLNQSGRIVHAGNGTLDLISDHGRNVGGTVISQGDVSITSDSWENSTLFQAAALNFNVGHFKQTASGQLIASRSLTATGDTWINEGLIASDGSLTLNLTGNYSGSGQVISLGTMQLTAQQFALGEHSIIYSQSSGRIDSQTLTNQGYISAINGLVIDTKQRLINQGTLGSEQRLSLYTPHLSNDNALIFSGADMLLRVDYFTNQYADVYSLGSIDLAGYKENSQAQRVENMSASMEAVGDFSLRSTIVENRRDILEIEDKGKYYAEIKELRCGAPYGTKDCSISSKKGRRQSVWQITEREKLEVTHSSVASNILAGGSLSLTGSELINSSSLISSGADLNLSFNQLNNLGVKSTDIEVQRVYVAPRQSKKGYRGNQNTAVNFNAKHSHGVQTGNIESDISRFIGTTLSYKSKGVPTEYLPGRKYMETPLAGDEYSAIIQAGGNVTIHAQQTLENSVIRPSYNYVSGGSRVDTRSPGGTHATQVNINSQLPPDLQQKQIDPTLLPGFNLPAGDKGLFRLSSQTVQQGAQSFDQNLLLSSQLAGSNPVQDSHNKSQAQFVLANLQNLQGQNHDHRYLIETNPALTNMRQFLSSDYLFSGLGLNTDQTQKRLGDGLYEQKLMRESLVARTGQRFIAGLTSDEAVFRYLMDNAIASKGALNLSVGISLSAEQVAALTHDIVWMEEHEMMGEKVLTPVLYLAQTEGRLAPNGALIQGQDLTLVSGGDLSNQGTLRASNALSAYAQNINNNGLIHAGERLSLLAEDSIYNRQGGILAGRDVDLTARTGDILNERTVTRHKSAAGNSRWESSFADSAARIEATRNLTLTAGRDIHNLGSVLDSRGDLHISAGRDVNLASVEERHSTNRGSHYLTAQTQQLGSETLAGDNLNIQAGRDLTAIASRVESGKDMQLVAGNDLTLASAANENHSYSKSKKATSQRDQVHQVGTQVQSGGQFVAVAGQDLTLVSSAIAANDEAYLVAGGKVQLLAEQDYDYSFSEKKKKGSFGRKSLKSDEHTQITHIGSSVSSGVDLTLISGDEQRYQAANLNSGGDLTLDSGAGIVFEGVKDLEQKSRIRSKSNWAWQSAKGKGNTDETLMQSQLQAQGEIAIRAAEKIQIDIKEVNQQSVSQTIDAMVQAEPQLAWLKEMEQRGDVDWRQVKELHDSFSYSQSGLGAPAAMVVAIVISYYVAGAASGMINSMAGATSGSGTAMAAAGKATASAVAGGVKVGSTVASGWANATFSGIVGGSAGGAAGAVSQGQDWRKPALTGGVTGGFAGYLSAGTYYNNPIHTAGNVSKYLGHGEWMSLSKELTKVGMNQAFGYGLSKVAKEVGLTAEELNWVLMAGSILGNQWGRVGSRFTKEEEGFSKTHMIGTKGVGNRDNVILGFPFDAMDIALGYQGLPDASVRDYLSILGTSNTSASGHSLGALGNIYLASNGLTEKVHLYSVPFGAVAPPNAKVMLGSWDFVNGGWAGKLLNWDAKVIPLAPWEHSFENYKKHITE